MRFAWDKKKASSNLLKHGVAFEEAAIVFGDALSNTFPDQDHSIEEQRFVIIGLSDQGRMLVVAHTDDGELVRIISAREATHGERKSYEES
jgi:uncharacterized DUF497 family protein